MPTITLDFSEVEEYAAIPKGTYPVRIDTVEVRIGKQSNEPYLNWTLVVTDGDYEGSKLFMTNGLSEKSLYYLREQFRNLGILEEDSDSLELEVDEDTNMVVYPEFSDMEALADVIVQVQKGKKVNQVDLLYVPQDDLPFEPDTPSKGKKTPVGGSKGKKAPGRKLK